MFVLDGGEKEVFKSTAIPFIRIFHVRLHSTYWYDEILRELQFSVVRQDVPFRFTIPIAPANHQVLQMDALSQLDTQFQTVPESGIPDLAVHSSRMLSVPAAYSSGTRGRLQQK